MHLSLMKYQDRKGNAEKVYGTAHCGGQVHISSFLKLRLGE